MTPKMKAQELIEKFREHAYPITTDEDEYEAQETRIAKACAAICVQEIIEETNGFIPELEKLYFKQRREYWQQVLTEIQSL